MAEIIKDYKNADNRHLYTQGSDNFQHTPVILPEDDFFASVRLSKNRLIRGSYGMCDAPPGHIQWDEPSTNHNYDNAIHPSGDVNSLTGSEEEMLSQAYDFFYASSKPAVQYYKEELEAAARSRLVAGCQILDLQDFTVQHLLAFLMLLWTPKGLQNLGIFHYVQGYM